MSRVFRVGAAQGSSAERESGPLVYSNSRFHVDGFVLSEDGFTLIVGWTDDRASELAELAIVIDGDVYTVRDFARCRRSDVESALKVANAREFGFWTLLQLPVNVDSANSVTVRAIYGNGTVQDATVEPRGSSNAELRRTVLGYISSVVYLGNGLVRTADALDAGLGKLLLDLNLRVSTQLKRNPFVLRLHSGQKSLKCSLIICLYGKVEFVFLQSALFRTSQAQESVELVYVLNSPELMEEAEKNARIAHHAFGFDITLVLLPGNAGFSAANNVAAQFARTDRLTFVNPDVIPRNKDWLSLYLSVLSGSPSAQTAIFGVPLYYDDGSVMHNGMYFDTDLAVSVVSSDVRMRTFLRVEHYHKGAPPESSLYQTARPVPAVTGAFVSVKRAWFERLTGFSEKYVLGHYEDADLCLRSIEASQPVWLHNVPFWHLEGRGSTRSGDLEGAMMTNRWLFSQAWGAIITDRLLGANPSHELLRFPPSSLKRGNRAGRKQQESSGFRRKW